jgi:hypothetical protein
VYRELGNDDRVVLKGARHEIESTEDSTRVVGIYARRGKQTRAPVKRRDTQKSPYTTQNNSATLCSSGTRLFSAIDIHLLYRFIYTSFRSSYALVYYTLFFIIKP